MLRQERIFPFLFFLEDKCLENGKGKFQNIVIYNFIENCEHQ